MKKMKRKKRRQVVQLSKTDKLYYNIVATLLIVIWLSTIIIHIILRDVVFENINGVISFGDSWTLLFMIIPTILLSIPFFIIINYMQKNIPFREAIKKMFFGAKKRIVAFVVVIGVIFSYFLLFFSGHLFFDSGVIISYSLFGIVQNEYTSEDVQYVELRLYRVSSGMRDGYAQGLSYDLHMKNGKILCFEHYHLEGLLIMDTYFSQKEKILICEYGSVDEWVQSRRANNEIKQNLYSLFDNTSITQRTVPCVKK